MGSSSSSSIIVVCINEFDKTTDSFMWPNPPPFSKSYKEFHDALVKFVLQEMPEFAKEKYQGKPTRLKIQVGPFFVRGLG